jgi:integrase
MLHQHRNGRADETVKYQIATLRAVAQTTNLNDPEAVKTHIANAPWKNTTKQKFTYTYIAYLRFKQIEWTPPTYKGESKFPFIPTEQEIDLLISGTGKLVSTTLQTLKETGIRIGELTQLKWTDLDAERKTLSITPEKNSNPRILPITDKLIGMINSLPRNRQTIFQPKKKALRDYLIQQRKHLAQKLNNPRIQKIGFHTLRHWKGTTEYHKTKDIIHVKTVLGHKSITSTMVYINLESALYLQTAEDFICKVAHDEAEETALIEAGFTFVNNREGLAFYKKRK